VAPVSSHICVLGDFGYVGAWSGQILQVQASKLTGSLGNVGDKQGEPAHSRVSKMQQSTGSEKHDWPELQQCKMNKVIAGSRFELAQPARK
jgi:hypothetical protein